MKKAAILQKIVSHLANELELFHRAAKASFEEATDEQNKAENKYDTRGLEASYLARGQARQVADTEQAIVQFQSLPLADFTESTPINVGALVSVETASTHQWYFIGPSAGGTEIQHGKETVVVITPQSPLGRVLQGRKQGEVIRLGEGRTARTQRILKVH